MRIRDRLGPIMLLLLAWFLAAFGLEGYLALADWYSLSLPMDPRIPYIASSVRAGEVSVLSSIPHFLRVLFLAALAVAVAELAKVWLAAVHQPRARAAALLISLFQFIFFWDSVRGHAYDWYVYSLSLLGIVDLAARSEQVARDGYRLPSIPVPSPIPSLLACGVVLVLLSLPLKRGAESTSVSR